VPLLTLPILESRRETPRNLVVRLGLGGHRFDFLAGQHVLLGDGGPEPRCPYSIASAPGEAARRDRLEFLIQVDAHGSPGPHLPSLAVGRCVAVEGPAGSFTLPADGGNSDFLFVAGGTGIAPIRSMVGHLLETRPGARVALVHAGRSPDELSYAEEFRALAREGRIRLIESVTRQAPDGWHGIRGRIGASHLAPLVSAPGTLAFVCGPDSLVDEVPRLLAALGVTGTKTEHWAG
jgi:phenol hydroxylase P5 protein